MARIDTPRLLLQVACAVVLAALGAPVRAQDTKASGPAAATVGAKPPAAGPAAAKPAEVKPAEAKPAEAKPGDAEPANGKSAGMMTLEAFLDRLMIAESGGRDDARNPRSTAVGPYQFIEATFLDIATRHFADETAKLPPAAVLLLRTNRAFARKAAAIYTRENASRLAAAGFEATFPRLRLAYLLGAGGAIRVLESPPDVPVARIVGPAVVTANPFMSRLTAGGLIARAARDLEIALDTRAGIKGGVIAARKKPAIPVRCDLALASCQRWLSLAKRRLAKGLPVMPKDGTRVGSR